MQTVELVGRLLISLAVVIGLIWMVSRKMRGGRRRSLRSDRLIDVLGRQNLTRSSSVAVVRVADRALIVGVTDSSVRVLSDIELDAVQAKLAEQDPSARRSGTGGGIPRQRSPRGRVSRTPSDVPTDITDDVVFGEPAFDEADFADAAADLDAEDAGIPASPAELAGMLTAADIEAIRARRAAAPNYVTPDAAPRGTPRARTTSPSPQPAGPLSGSALSPATWRQTLDALRDLTARKG